MKSKKYFIRCTSTILILLLLVACEDYLNRELSTDLDYTQVTESYTYTGYRLSSIYSVLRSGFNVVDGAMMASASDEAEHTLETSNVQMFNIGSWNPYSNPDVAWVEYYIGIRRVNQFLVSVDNINLDLYKFDPSPAQQAVYTSRLAEIKRWKYEARFLRAFFYFELVKRYGGVPLLTSAGSIIDDYGSITRNTLTECLQFITDECDSTASILPVTYAAADLGRATKGAALALKSRALLYAASDLFNTPSLATGYAHPELISLTGDRQVRWQAAADAAKSVIDLAGTGYQLSTSYSGLFGTATFSNAEVIFCRRNDATNSFEIANYPIGFYLGQSGTTPSQNLVDAYEMTNGKLITEQDSEYDPQDPYINRDPRLAMTILTNNSMFKGRRIESWQGGLDGKPIANATKTGYYLKKYLNADINLITNTTSVHSWIFFRLAEIYLNYAEALNECQPGHEDIELYVNKVRQRSGVSMPALTTGLTQSEMRDKIRHERRIEFAFEDHRLWDLRRWMLASTHLATPLKGMHITKNTDGTFNYEVIDVENRVFQSKMYLYPIPQNEILIAGGLIQNPSW